MIIMMIWRILQVHCDIIHGKEAVAVAASADFFVSYMNLVQLAKRYSIEEMLKGKMVIMDYGEGPLQSPLARVLPWPAPASCVTTLSVDGSFREEDGMAAARMILRRPEGSFLPACRYLFNCNDALEAEIHTLMIGMALAQQHTELSVMVQSDSSSALSCPSQKKRVLYLVFLTLA